MELQNGEIRQVKELRWEFPDQRGTVTAQLGDLGCVFNSLENIGQSELAREVEAVAVNWKSPWVDNLK